MEQDRKERLLELIGKIQGRKKANFDGTPIEIHSKLFIGSVGAAYNHQALVDCSISHILCVAASIELRFTKDFVYKRVDIKDHSSEKISNHFEECFSFIDAAISSGGSVLVHCFAGKSRSATVIIAYLMIRLRIPFLRALELVRSKRPEVSPNLGFVAQLRVFERSLNL